MIRANNSAIDVDELMQRVRAEAAQIRASGVVDAQRGDPRDLDDSRFSRAVERTRETAQLLAVAGERNQPRTEVPPRLARLGPLGRFGLRVFNYVFKQQREIDQAQTQAAQVSLHVQIATADYVERVAERIRGLEQYRAETFAELRATLTAIEVRLGETNERLAHAHERIDVDERDVQSLAGNLRELDAAVRRVQDVIAGVDGRLQRSEQHAAALDARAQITPIGTEVRVQILDLQRALEQRLGAVQDRSLRSDALLRGELAELRRSGGNVGSGNPDVEPRPEPVEAAIPDALYEEIEDRFRGSSDVIRARLAEHLDRLRSVGTIATKTPVLDIGCGRGEWLDLLREHGLAAIGIDTNRIAVQEASARGADARLADARAFLGAQPSASLGAITAFHVVEHIAFGEVVALLREALRVLVPGGLLLLETPNPENLLVATRFFRFDPTHRDPIPRELLCAAVEACGFAGVESIVLHPCEPLAFPLDGPLSPLNAYFSGPQDYAVVATAPR